MASSAQQFASASWADGPFVGRNRELEELARCADAAAAGRGVLVLLAGEAGIGKSRTANELSRRARARGLETLWGRCYEGDGAPAYRPWVQVIRACLEACDRTADGDPAPLRTHFAGGADDVATLVPELRDRLPGLAPPTSMEPAQARFRLFDSITTFLRNAARRQPLVVVLDDLHCADTSSLLLLQFVARELPATAILLLATYRDGEVGPGHALFGTLATLVREPATRRLALAGLGTADVARYVEAATGATPSDVMLNDVAERTRGNPFFVSEIVRLLATEGGSVRSGVPQSVHAVVALRLDGLSIAGRDLLRLAAVVGREFGIDLLTDAGDLPHDRLLALLDELMGGRLIAEVPGAVGRYRFVDALVRDVVYGSLAMTRRLKLHRAIGEALERLHAADPGPRSSELAHHFITAAPAGGVDKAIAWSRRAGEAATERLAFEEAVHHYRGALDALALRGPRAERDRCELHLALADAHARAGDETEARAASERAATIARALRAPELLARAPLASGAWWGVSAPSADLGMTALLDEALSAMHHDDSSLRAAGLARLATGLHWTRAFERAVAVSEDAVAMARRLGDLRSLVRCLNAQHYVLQAPDRLGERLVVADEMLRTAGAAGDLDMVAAARRWRMVDLLELGDIVAVEREIDACVRLAAALRQPALAWYAETFRALRSFMTGRFAEGEEIVRGAAVLGERAIGAGAGEASRAQLGLALWQQGRFDELATTLTVAPERFPVYRCCLIMAQLALGAEAEARREFDELARDDFAGVPFDAEWLPSLTLLAVACFALRDAERAATLYRMLLPYADRNVVLGIGAWTCLGSAAGPLGLLATSLQRWDDAAGHFCEAIAMDRRMGMRPWVAQYQFAYGRMLLQRGFAPDRKRAQAMLREADDAAREMGLRRLVADLEPLLAPAAAAAAAGRATLRREGDYWTVEHDGAVGRLKDVKGLGYLARLLAEPGREFHVLDLMKARAEAASASERARSAVTQNIRSVIRRLEQVLPMLGTHLALRVKTGTFCTYLPDPENPLCWTV